MIFLPRTSRIFYWSYAIKLYVVCVLYRHCSSCRGIRYQVARDAWNTSPTCAHRKDHYGFSIVEVKPANSPYKRGTQVDVAPLNGGHRRRRSFSYNDKLSPHTLLVFHVFFVPSPISWDLRAPSGRKMGSSTMFKGLESYLWFAIATGEADNPICLVLR